MYTGGVIIYFINKNEVKLLKVGYLNINNLIL